MERVKDQDLKWYFLLSDNQYTYLYCDSERYETLEEMTKWGLLVVENEREVLNGVSQ